MAKSNGQVLIEDVEAYIGRYVSLPNELKDQGLVMALWVVHTWMYERFPSTPYLTITAATKQAGKTLCMEVLALVCRGAQSYATLRPLMLVRVIEAFNGLVTLFLDEAEKLSSGALGDLRSIFTSGYRVGGRHGISVGKEFVNFRTFAPKCFALIGDVMDVVRDRSIVIHLKRGTPAVDFLANMERAQGEAALLVERIVSLPIPSMVQPMFLNGREREIWTVLYSIADGLGLDAATMRRLESITSDLIGLKSVEARRYSEAQAAEDSAGDLQYGQAALRDLHAVLGDERSIFSDVAVERMLKLSTGPWRTFRGEGLNAHTLANLLSPFGLSPVNVRRGKVVKRGYKAGEVVKAHVAAMPVRS